MLKARLPGSDVLTSRVPLYVHEIPGIVQQLYQGIEQGEDYRRIRLRLGKPSVVRKRLIFPDSSENLKHFDFDRNGVLDDKQAVEEIQVMDRSSRKAAQKLMSGVHYLETFNPYYADESSSAVFTQKAAATPVVARGIELGDGKRVTHISDRAGGGFDIKLDAKFKNAPKQFIGAASVYELQMHLQDKLLGTSVKMKQARALAFATHYLTVNSRDLFGDAQKAFKQLLQHAKLPPISFMKVGQTVSSGHIIGEPQIAEVQKLLDESSKKAEETPR
jgi:hypothetical protein